MVRWCLLLAVALPACFDPTFTPGRPCSSSGACPPGQFCVEGVCETSPAADAAVDAAPPDGAPDAAPPPFCTPGEPDVVLCYEFDLMAAVIDLSGRNHAGTPNTQVAETPDGWHGPGLDFDDGGEVQIGGEAAEFDLSALTIEAMVFVQEAPASLRSAVIAAGGRWDLAIESTSSTAFSCSFGATRTLAVSLADGWHHLACARDVGGAVKAFADGVERASEDVITTGTGSPVRMGGIVCGASPCANPGQLDAIVDNLRIWSRALSPDEICTAAGALCQL